MSSPNINAILRRIEAGDPAVISEIIPFVHANESFTDQVFDALEAAAEKSNAEFAEFLGYNYSFKFGGPRKGDAIKFLEIAAGANRPWAEYILAGIYRKKAEKLLRQAAEDGSPTAAKEYLKGLADARPDADAAFELATDIVRGLNDKAFLESTFWYNLLSPADRMSPETAKDLVKDGFCNEVSRKEALKYARMAAEADVPGAAVLVESLLTENHTKE